jgi:hypothetical protein
MCYEENLLMFDGSFKPEAKSLNKLAIEKAILFIFRTIHEQSATL